VGRLLITVPSACLRGDGLGRDLGRKGIVSDTSTRSALLDFEQARRRAQLEVALGLLTGKTVDLICYGDVRDKLDVTHTSGRELRDIELDRIVGSVGRCSDFTRSFLPRRESDAPRWVRAEMNVGDLAGLPPIEVFEVGGIYFVQDGHHRVSVAREMGAEQIQAYVTKVRSRVSVPPDADPDDVIRLAEYDGFLSKTHLDETYPTSDFRVSVAGQYRRLLKHIDVHRHVIGLEQEKPVPYQEAAADWYENVYRPVLEVIRAHGMMREFPHRTETDLYLWIVEHREELRDELGWDVKTDAAAEDLIERYGGEGGLSLARIPATLRRAVTTGEGRPRKALGEEPGSRSLTGTRKQLLRDVLVVIDGEEAGWRALRQVQILARREDLTAHGLHVSSDGLDAKEKGALTDHFRNRLADSPPEGDLTFRSGEVARHVVDLARWTDLVVLGLTAPSEDTAGGDLERAVRSIVAQCPTPLLFVPGVPSRLDRAVLAYDGSPKADQALYLAAYLASHWGVDLTVVTGQERGGPKPGALKRAGRYLAEHQIEAQAIAAEGAPGEAVMRVAGSVKASLIIMGGYGLSPLLTRVLGSTVNHVLRESAIPVWICR